jgi:hypothetical protein
MIVYEVSVCLTSSLHIGVSYPSTLGRVVREIEDFDKNLVLARRREGLVLELEGAVVAFKDGVSVRWSREDPLAGLLS